VTAEVPISRGLVAIVDDADLAAVVAAGPWHACPRGRTVYVQSGVRRPDGRWTTQQLHTFPTGWQLVDHINRNGLDNRRSNLRPATHSQNSANAGRQTRSTSGFKGVHRGPVRGKAWRAQIHTAGKKRHLGTFDDPEEAARAYDAAAVELFGEFARTNFPQEIPS
jgi:hypothetical protein